MTFRIRLRPAILGSALGLIPLLGCFGSSDDKGDNVGPAQGPIRHDGTKTDDVSQPRDKGNSVVPPGKSVGLENPVPQATKPAGPE